MKAVAALCFVLAIGFAHCGLLPASTLVRTPSLDSAIIKSDRLGGNFAYSTVEGHAYSAISPVVQRVTQPVAVSYTAHQVPLGYAAAPIAVQQPIAHTFISQPYLHQQVLSTPLLSGVIAGSPLVAGGPILAESPLVAGGPILAESPLVAGGPILAESPLVPGGPILAGSPVVAAGAVPAPIAPVAPIAPAAPAPVQADPVPAQGSLVDEDTVSVESA